MRPAAWRYRHHVPVTPLRDDAGDPAEPRARSHRASGPAKWRMPPPTFAKTLRDDPREVLAIAFLVVLGVSFGIRALRSSQSLALNLAGVTAIVAAALLVVSYVAHFKQGALEGPRWSASPTRRLLRGVIRHYWWITLAIYFMLGLVLLIWW